MNDRERRPQRTIYDRDRGVIWVDTAIWWLQDRVWPSWMPELLRDILLAAGIVLLIAAGVAVAILVVR